MAAANQLACINYIYFKAEGEDGSKGECRRYPPQCTYDPEGETLMVNFPYIFDSLKTYCGECVIPEEETE